MTLQQLPLTSEFFDIWWDDNVAFDAKGVAQGRARALQDSCDDSFRTLMQWFGVGGSKAFGQNNRIRVDVTDDPQFTKGNLGINGGFVANGGMRMAVTIYTQPKPDIADDAVRSVWLHESAEILMSYRRSTTGVDAWDPTSSDGEGLADTLQGLFYPRGYYGAGFGPRSSQWWQNRQDHVTQNDTKNGQSNPLSSGCAIVFLYYLYSQLGLRFDDIIAKGGNSLEATYRSMTGRQGGYAAMMDVIGQHIAPATAPLTDNPFPLGWQQAEVSLRAEQQATFPPFTIAQGKVTVRPFFTCPEKEYSYRTFATHNQLVCTADITGFGQPECDWAVNGVPVRGTGTVTMSVMVAEDDPHQPDGTALGSRQVDLTYVDLGDTSTYAGRASSLRLGIDALGHGALDIDVYVVEGYQPQPGLKPGLPPRRASGHFMLDTEQTSYAEPFASDRQSCQGAFEKSFEKYQQINRVLNGSTASGVNVQNVIEQVKDELKGLKKENPGLALQVGKVLSARLRLPPATLDA